MTGLAENEGLDTYDQCANSLIICLNGMREEYVEKGNDVTVARN